jgi:hypothetical protein
MKKVLMLKKMELAKILFQVALGCMDSPAEPNETRFLELPGNG